MTFCRLLLFSLLTLACGSAPSQPHKEPDGPTPSPLLYIRDIANQTQEDIATILGPQSQLDPESAVKSGCPTCQKYSYQDGKIEIVYINDMADWITVFPPEGTLASRTLPLLGLAAARPDGTRPTAWRWNQVAGIREIKARLSPAGTVESIYIVVKTPPAEPR